uniref:Lipase domain-containing protein n=1 Tax=Elaeophora elaphi TaxID=1147741 RepID=A0A0R3S0Q6_9BILA
MLSSMPNQLVAGSLSLAFYTWLNDTYGQLQADRLLRNDLGVGGSFGGGNHNAGHQTKNEPVILVHGIASRIDLFNPTRMYFLRHDYDDEEVYGTTYGDAHASSIIFDGMKCEYVRRIRELILSVSAFTASRVDIIAYSTGSPIARKAIMGGMCVEGSDDLGRPLTELVDTFLSVAGTNYGSNLCIIPFGSCNSLNGLHCLSKFLDDINSKQHYEGSHIFTLYSKSDEKVSYKSCGKLASAIDGEDGKFEVSSINHPNFLI